MTMEANLFQDQILRATGLAMVNSVWQGALVFVTVKLVVGLAGRGNARFRYSVFCGGLLLTALLFVCSFLAAFRSADAFPSLSRASAGLPDAWLSPAQLSPAYGPDFFKQPLQVVRPYLERMYPVLALFWMAGFLWFGFRLLAGMMLSRSLILKGTVDPPAPVLEAFERMRQRLGCSPFIRLRMALRQTVPLVTGFLRPVVVIPIAMLSDLSPLQVDAILAHELSHIKRYDQLFILLQVIARQFVFFNPVAWYLSAAIDREREHCCDDLVLETGNDRINYIKALTMIQEMNIPERIPATAATGRPKHLLYRIRRLVSPPPSCSPFMRLSMLCIFLAAAGIILAASIDSTGIKKGSLFSQVSFGLTTRDAVKGQDTSRIIIEKKALMNDGESEGLHDSMQEIRVTLANDTIREITVNGKAIPPAQYDSLLGSSHVMILHDKDLLMNRGIKDPLKVPASLKVLADSILYREFELTGKDSAGSASRRIIIFRQDADTAGSKADRQMEIMITKPDLSSLKVDLDRLMAINQSALEKFREQYGDTWMQWQEQLGDTARLNSIFRELQVVKPDYKEIYEIIASDDLTDSVYQHLLQRRTESMQQWQEQMNRNQEQIE